MPTRCPPFSHVPAQLSSPPRKLGKPSPETRKALPNYGTCERARKPLRTRREPGTRTPDPEVPRRSHFGTHKPRFWNACSRQTQRDCRTTSNFDGGGREPGTRGIDPSNQPGDRLPEKNPKIFPKNIVFGRPGKPGCLSYPQLCPQPVDNLLTTQSVCGIMNITTYSTTTNRKGECL